MVYNTKGQMSYGVNMLRTNSNFLSYIENIYNNGISKDILIRDFSKGTYIFNQGFIYHKVAIIKSGFVKCFYSEDNGKEFILEFLGSGEIVGDIEAIRHIECLCNIKAVTDIQIYTFSTSFFRTLLDNNSLFRDVFLSELAERLINTSYRASFQKAYSAKYGLLKLLNMQKKQNIKLSKLDMASYLGIDIRSLNRSLKEILEKSDAKKRQEGENNST